MKLFGCAFVWFSVLAVAVALGRAAEILFERQARLLASLAAGMMHVNVGETNGDSIAGVPVPPM